MISIHRYPLAFCLCILTLLFALSASCAFAAQETSPQVPDVVIIIASGITADDMVSITYSAKTSDADVQRDIQSLRTASGWQIPAVKSNTASVQKNGDAPLTSVEFSAPLVVNRVAGSLPVEPFLLAYKNDKIIEIHYLIQGNFLFKGLKNYSNKYVDIQFNQAQSTYNYRAAIKNNSFKELNLPVVVEEKSANTANTTAKSGGLSFVKVLLALVIAAVAGFAVYTLSSRLSKKQVK